jgi:predicted RNase H-like HicB family nuclease
MKTAVTRPSPEKWRRMERLRERFFRYDLCMELIFEVREAEEGGYVARALGQAIFTEAETWAELRDNVREVTSLHFDDAAEMPKLIQLHFVKDELIAVEAA